MQLSKLCDQQILLVIYDKNLGKMYKYISEDGFDVKDANEIIETVNNTPRTEENEQDLLQIFNYTNRDILKFSDADGMDEEDEKQLSAAQR